MEKDGKKIFIDGNAKFGKALFDNLIKAFNESKSKIVIEQPNPIPKPKETNQTPKISSKKKSID